MASGIRAEVSSDGTWVHGLLRLSTGFDLSRDKEEKNNLAAEQAEEVARITNLYSTWKKDFPPPPWGGGGKKGKKNQDE